MNVEEFKILLASQKSDSHICRSFLFDSEVWLLKHKGFEEPAKVYDQLRLFFADRMKLPHSSVSLVGSAKTGFSLNPKKNFRPFSEEESDIDVVLVSDKYFGFFWDELLRFHYSGHKIRYIEASIFRKFVRLDRSASLPSDAMRDWNQKFDELKRDFFTMFGIGNGITYRIYQNWEAAEQYHSSGITKLRQLPKESKHDEAE